MIQKNELIPAEYIVSFLVGYNAFNLRNGSFFAADDKAQHHHKAQLTLLEETYRLVWQSFSNVVDCAQAKVKDIHADESLSALKEIYNTFSKQLPQWAADVFFVIEYQTDRKINVDDECSVDKSLQIQQRIIGAELELYRVVANKLFARSKEKHILSNLENGLPDVAVIDSLFNYMEFISDLMQDWYKAIRAHDLICSDTVEDYEEFLISFEKLVKDYELYYQNLQRNKVSTVEKLFSNNLRQAVLVRGLVKQNPCFFQPVLKESDTLDRYRNLLKRFRKLFDTCSDVLDNTFSHSSTVHNDHCVFNNQEEMEYDPISPQY